MNDQRKPRTTPSKRSAAAVNRDLTARRMSLEERIKKLGKPRRRIQE